MISNNLYLLKDKRWILDRYWGDELSARQLIKTHGFSEHSLTRWMRKFCIPTRDLSYAQHISHRNKREILKISPTLEQFLYGELLGDMCVYPSSQYTASIRYESKYEEYVMWLSNFLNGYNLKQSGNIRKRINNNATTYCYSSISNEYLMAVRKKWYPNDIKIVPKDIELTSLVCRQFYIGDGGIGKSHEVGSYICLATMGFKPDDVVFLADKLCKLGFDAHRTSVNGIYISTASSLDFLNYIGVCPVECYQYKWMHQRQKIKKEQ